MMEHNRSGRVFLLISARLRYGVVNCDEQTLKVSGRAASAAFRLTAVGLLALYIRIHVVYPFIATLCEGGVSGWLATMAGLMLWYYIGFYYYYGRRGVPN